MILGNDVASYQGDINFDLYRNNSNFIIAKATEGTGFTDPKFKRNQSEARRVGILRGWYAFARPDLGNSAEAEADWFLSVVGQLQEGEILVLDYECPNQKPSHVAWCKAWLDRVYSRTGVRPLIYLNQSQVKQFDWKPVVDGGYGLWIAAYTYDPNNNNAQIGQWTFAAMQQWTNGQTVPGIPAVADGDVFFGSEQAFKSYGYKRPASSSVSPSASPSSSQSSTPSPSQSSSPSSSRSSSPSSSPSPSFEPPANDSEKLKQLTAVINSTWSGWFFSPFYWKNKYSQLKKILNG